MALKLSSYNVPVVDYQQLFREHYTEDEFGIEPANAHWSSLMPDLLDDVIEQNSTTIISIIGFVIFLWCFFMY